MCLFFKFVSCGLCSNVALKRTKEGPTQKVDVMMQLVH